VTGTLSFRRWENIKHGIPSLYWYYVGYIIKIAVIFNCRSQWPRALRHELSSPAPTLKSWVRIPLESWMSVCVYSVCDASCLQVVVLRRADPPFKESYWVCKRSRNWKAAKVQQNCCRTIDT
jgi:hypothetical protein